MGGISRSGSWDGTTVRGAGGGQWRTGGVATVSTGSGAAIKQGGGIPEVSHVRRILALPSAVIAIIAGWSWGSGEEGGAHQLGRLTPPSRTLWRGCGSFSAGEERGVRWLGAALPRAWGLNGRDAARSCCCGGTALGRPSLSRQCTNNVGRAVGTGGRRSGGYQGPGRFPLQKWVRLE